MKRALPRKRPQLLFGLGLTMLVLLGCGSAAHDGAASPTAEGAVGAPIVLGDARGVVTPDERDAALAAVPLDTVRLIDAGAAPHAVRAYAVAAGATQIVEMKLRARDDTGAALSDDEVALYAEVESRVADGRVTLRGVLLGGNPALVGASAEAEHLANGALVERPPPADRPARCAAPNAQFGVLFRELRVQLPREPIGVGARWQSLRARTDDALELIEVHTSELLSIDGSTLRIRTRAVAYAVMPAGEGELRRFTSEATHDVEVDLSQVLFRAATVDGSVIIDAEGADGPEHVGVRVASTAALRARGPKDPLAPAKPACMAEGGPPAECKAFIDTINAGQNVFKAVGSDPALYEQHARDVEAFAARVGEVPLNDAKLRSERADYEALVRDMAGVLRDVAAGKDLATLERRIDGITAREDRVLKAVNGYCVPE